MNWEECQEATKDFNMHYSMTEPQHKIIYDLASTLPPESNILELGVCNGKTFAILLYCSRTLGFHLFGVDTFQLQRPETGDDTLAEVVEKLDRIGGPYTLSVSDTRTYEFQKPLDFLIVDAGHDEANVSVDCRKYVPLVKPGGYVAFHDYPLHDSREDPHWAVRYYGNLYTPGWEEITYYGGLMIKRRPA